MFTPGYLWASSHQRRSKNVDSVKRRARSGEVGENWSLQAGRIANVGVGRAPDPVRDMGLEVGKSLLRRGTTAILYGKISISKNAFFIWVLATISYYLLLCSNLECTLLSFILGSVGWGHGESASYLVLA